jgi:hypothetical protein
MQKSGDPGFSTVHRREGSAFLPDGEAVARSTDTRRTRCSGRLDQIGCEEGERDRHVDLAEAALLARGNNGSWWLYSITSSASASIVGGRSRPRAFAVLRLITNSNLVGCSTGRSAGLAPLRIRST